MPEADSTEQIVVKVLVKAEFVSSLYEALPDMKLLLVVKNPITRIVSHIVHEYVNPGGVFQGKPMPAIDDIIMGRVKLSVPDIGKYTRQKFTRASGFTNSQDISCDKCRLWPLIQFLLSYLIQMSVKYREGIFVCLCDFWKISNSLDQKFIS